MSLKKINQKLHVSVGWMGLISYNRNMMFLGYKEKEMRVFGVSVHVLTFVSPLSDGRKRSPSDPE